MLVNLPEKRYYSIGEIAKAFNVNTSLLRFWEKEFAEIEPKKKREWYSKIYVPRCGKYSTNLSFNQRERPYARGNKKAIKT